MEEEEGGGERAEMMKPEGLSSNLSCALNQACIQTVHLLKPQHPNSIYRFHTAPVLQSGKEQVIDSLAGSSDLYLL